MTIQLGEKALMVDNMKLPHSDNAIALRRPWVSAIYPQGQAMTIEPKKKINNIKYDGLTRSSH